MARPSHQHYRYARACGLHHGGGAQPPRPRRGGGRVRRRRRASSRSPRRCGARPTATTCRASASSTRWTASAPTSSRRWRSIRERLGANPVCIQLPIGAENDFKGIIDLVRMEAIVYTDDLGTTSKRSEIPAEMAEQVAEYRHTLLEAAADCDDELMIKYLDGEDPTADELVRALRSGTVADQDRAGALRQRAEEQGRAADARRRRRLPAVAARQAGHRGPARRQARDPPRQRRGPLLRAGVQDRHRPLRRQAHLLPRVQRRAAQRQLRVQRHQGRARARRPHPADARQPPRGDRGGARRRHRRRHRPAQDHHRRHALRRAAPDHPRVR